MKFRSIIELHHLRDDFLAIGEDGELYLLEVEAHEKRATATKMRVGLVNRDPILEAEEEDDEDEDEE